MTPETPPAAKIGLAAYYNLVMCDRGFNAAPHHVPICLGLEDTRISNLMVLGPPGTGKSTLLGVVYPTYRVGHDPATTVLGISAGEKLISTFIHAAGEIIQHSPHFKNLFPTVRPDMSAGWSSDRGLFVTGRPIGDQDASVLCRRFEVEGPDRCSCARDRPGRPTRRDQQSNARGPGRRDRDLLHDRDWPW